MRGGICLGREILICYSTDQLPHTVSQSQCRLGLGISGRLGQTHTKLVPGVHIAHREFRPDRLSGDLKGCRKLDRIAVSLYDGLRPASLAACRILAGSRRCRSSQYSSNDELTQSFDPNFPIVGIRHCLSRYAGMVCATLQVSEQGMRYQ